MKNKARRIQNGMENVERAVEKKAPNKATLEVYNRTAELYTEITPTYANRPLLEWIDRSLEFVPAGAKVLEIGSAIPRDAQYMRSKGFDVTCTDGAQAFVDLLQRQGEPAFLLDILEDEIPERYHMIFANAVVPHFTPADLRFVLKKVHAALLPGGVFAFSAKQGDGEEWTSERLNQKRFMHYWHPEKLRDLVEQEKYAVPYMKTDNPGNIPNHRWISVIAKKSD